MSEEPKVGVLEAERRRVQAWRDAGLPDPSEILTSERHLRRVHDLPRDWRLDADRAPIDDFIAEHGVEALPNPLPNGW